MDLARSPTTAQAAPSAAAARDADIAALILQGDHAKAFELLADRYEAKVHRLCVAMLREPAAAQDAAQDSLLRAWKALASYDGRAALSTWLYAITRNRCLTAIQSRRDTLSLSDEAVEAEAQAVAAPTAQAEAEAAATIRQLVGELPEAARQVITLFYFEERSVAEVAAMLDSPQGTVKTQLFRARAALLARLSDLGLADPERWIA